MSNKSIKSTLHTARFVMSFALLGAVACGAFFGGFDMDIRPIGAIAGAGVAIAYKVLHLI